MTMGIGYAWFQDLFSGMGANDKWWKKSMV
jgi:hypothetical protein